MVRKITYTITVTLVLLCSVLIVPPFVFTRATGEWLAGDLPAEAGILVVEGWIPEYTSYPVFREFIDGGYDLIITTGQPHGEVLNVSHNGYVEFDLESAGVDWDAGSEVNIVLYAFGEKALGEYARYTIIHNGDTIGRGYSGPEMEAYRYNYEPAGKIPGLISVVFDNDFVHNGEDRNLHVLALEAGDFRIPVRSPHTSLVRRRGGVETRRPLHHRSLAEEKAWYLIQQGIDSNMIVPLTSPETGVFRTFTDAVTVSHWLTVVGNTRRGINVYTHGGHARRSRILYRYAIPGSVEVGVIAFPDPGIVINDGDWTLSEKMAIFREYAAYLYTRTLFNSRLHYRRIKRNLSPVNSVIFPIFATAPNYYC